MTKPTSGRGTIISSYGGVLTPGVAPADTYPGEVEGRAGSGFDFLETGRGLASPPIDGADCMRRGGGDVNVRSLSGSTR